MEFFAPLIAGGVIIWLLIKSQERKTEEWNRQAEEAKKRKAGR